MECIYCENSLIATLCTEIVDVHSRRDHLKKKESIFSAWQEDTVHNVAENAVGNIINSFVSANPFNLDTSQYPASRDNQESNPPPNSNTTANTTGAQAHVLLQTTKARAWFASGSWLLVGVLLDGGSQKSYIMDELKCKLGF